MTLARHAWVRRALRAAPWLLALAVLVLVVRQARTIDWHAVRSALDELTLVQASVAAALALLSHGLVASFDLIGRRLTRHRLTRRRTMATAGVCYAFNLNFGALLGGMALRLRLYSRLGLDAGTVGRIIASSWLTNWLGYALVAGAVWVLRPPPLGLSALDGAVLCALGLALLGTAAAYLVACGRGPRTLYWRGHAWPLPGLRLAGLQAGVAAANWMLMGTIVWWLLDARVDYPLVLGVLLAAAVAGVVTHVPAGLGVLEAVFVAALGSRVPVAELLAALLAYRALYYLLPLAFALPAYAVGELRARRGTAPAAAGPRQITGSG